MADWVLKGLRTGIKTTAYPQRPEKTSGVSPGRPIGTSLGSAKQAEKLSKLCPTGAIARDGRGVTVDFGRCVHCYRCHPDAGDEAVSWDLSYEWAADRDELASAKRKLDKAFGRSLYLRFVDAGACGACVSEARQLNNPYYNMHRLGFFTTPTPRNADVLLVAGPVSDAMRIPLRQTYEAMPDPKRVVVDRSLCIVWRSVRSELCRVRWCVRNHSGRCRSAWVPAAAFGHPPRPSCCGRKKTSDEAGVPGVPKQEGGGRHEHGVAALRRILCALRCGPHQLRSLFPRAGNPLALCNLGVLGRVGHPRRGRAAPCRQFRVSR